MRRFSAQGSRDRSARPAETDRVLAGLAAGSLEPWVEKRRMARQVVDLYHGPGAGEAAEARFDQVHREHELPDEIEELSIPQDAIRDGAVFLPRLLAGLGLASSNSEARRLLEQGGVRLDGEPVGGEEARPEVLRGHVLQVGRRRFVRLRSRRS